MGHSTLLTQSLTSKMAAWFYALVIDVKAPDDLMYRYDKCATS